VRRCVLFLGAVLWLGSFQIQYESN
jgi:hypothetical protein